MSKTLFSWLFKQVKVETKEDKAARLIAQFADDLNQTYPNLVSNSEEENSPLPLGAHAIPGKEGPSGDGDPEYYFEIGTT